MVDKYDVYFPEKIVVSTFEYQHVSLCLAKYKVIPFLYIIKHGVFDSQPATPPRIGGFNVRANMDVCMFKDHVYVVDLTGCTLKIGNDGNKVISDSFLPLPD